MITKICTYNLNSILHKSYEELNSVSIPDFVQGYNLTEHYTGLIDKLIGVSDKTAQEYPLLLLNWFLDCYHNEDSYIPTVLKKSLEMEPSSGIRKLILTAMGSILEYGVADYQKLQSLTESKKGLIAQMKRNGLRSIEEDLYEYNMRLRNVDTQDDAILLMRQINSRMSILEEYLRNDTDIDEKDKQRWESCLNSYMQLRSDLTKKTVYNKKMYGLFVDYNALQSMSQNNQMMNTYY